MAALRQCVTAIPAIDKSKWPNLMDPKTVYWKDYSAIEKWKKCEVNQDNDGVWTIGGKPILQKRYIITVAWWFHEMTHEGGEAIVNQVQKVWETPGNYAAAKTITNDCLTCQKFLSTRPSLVRGATICQLPSSATASRLHRYAVR